MGGIILFLSVANLFNYPIQSLMRNNSTSQSTAFLLGCMRRTLKVPTNINARIMEVKPPGLGPLEDTLKY